MVGNNRSTTKNTRQFNYKKGYYMSMEIKSKL